MKPLVCKQCGKEREIGRRLCRPCNLDRLKLIIKSKPRYKWQKMCPACKNEFPAHRKEQVLCIDCYRKMNDTKSKSINTNNYIYTNKPGRTEHRALAIEILGRELQTNEVVHHLDDDPKNNSVTNLMVLDRRSHGRLHLFLDQQRVIIEQSMTENFENCWKTLIAPMTTTWLETANVKVIKLWEIGQSAAESLSNGKGSETMHGASLVEDDIVQTTTEMVSES